MPRPKDQKVIGCLWVHKTKTSTSSTIDKRKSRLVQGFLQTHGIDYKETFSPVVKATSIRFAFFLAVSFGPLHQLDINNAFLNGDLIETLHMKQPQGFVDSFKFDLVCLLKKSLYEFKQALRA